MDGDTSPGWKTVSWKIGCLLDEQLVADPKIQIQNLYHPCGSPDGMDFDFAL